MELNARDLMNTRFHSLSPETPVGEAVELFRRASTEEGRRIFGMMIFSDVHRSFVQQARPEDIVGVFSLTDAACIRSGSCQACMSSRIKVEG